VVLFRSVGHVQETFRANEAQDSTTECSYRVAAIRLTGHFTSLLATAEIPQIWRSATQGRKVSQPIRFLANAGNRTSLAHRGMRVARRKRGALELILTRCGSSERELGGDGKGGG
jgi:hypothetical protein